MAKQFTQVRIKVEGNLAADVETKKNAKDQDFAKGLLIENGKDTKEFYNIVAKGSLKKTFAGMKKGAWLYVEGNLVKNKTKTADGKTVESKTIFADKIRDKNKEIEQAKQKAQTASKTAEQER